MVLRKKWLTMLMVVTAVLLLGACGGKESPSDKPVNDSGSPQDGSQTVEQNEEDKQSEEDKEDVPTREEVEEEYGEIDGYVLHDIKDVTEEVTVTEVIEGDTIVVNTENGEETVRLALIDAPDMDSNTPYGYELAALDSTELLLGMPVLLERVESAKDENGNTLGHIWIENSPEYKNYSTILLSKGRVKVDAPDSNAKYLDEFKQAEQEAKEADLGIWKPDGYVTEDGFNPPAGK
jgi:micrococcal nuclease